MGSALLDPDADITETPPHRVQITKPFTLGMHEVTVGQFRQFAAATGYTTELEKLERTTGAGKRKISRLAT